GQKGNHMYNAHAMHQGLWGNPLLKTKPKQRTRVATNRIKVSSAIETLSQVETNGTRAQQTDEELFLAHRLHRNPKAFEELVHRYERELYSYLRRYLSDATLAEDVFQATFLQLYLKAGQFEEGRK